MVGVYLRIGQLAGVRAGCGILIVRGIVLVREQGSSIRGFLFVWGRVIVIVSESDVFGGLRGATAGVAVARGAFAEG